MWNFCAVAIWKVKFDPTWPHLKIGKTETQTDCIMRNMRKIENVHFFYHLFSYILIFSAVTRLNLFSCFKSFWWLSQFFSPVLRTFSYLLCYLLSGNLVGQLIFPGCRISSQAIGIHYLGEKRLYKKEERSEHSLLIDCSSHEFACNTVINLKIGAPKISRLFESWNERMTDSKLGLNKKKKASWRPQLFPIQLLHLKLEGVGFLCLLCTQYYLINRAEYMTGSIFLDERRSWKEKK